MWVFCVNKIDKKDRLRLKPQIDKIEIDEKIGTRLRRNTASKPRRIAGQAELAQYTLARALITGGGAALTPGCVLVAPVPCALRARAHLQGLHADACLILAPLFPCAARGRISAR